MKYQPIAPLATLTTLLAPLLLLLINPSPCDAFVSPLNDMVRSMSTISMRPYLPTVSHPSLELLKSYTNTIRRATTRLNAIPTLDNWIISKSGEATGRVSNHPNPSIYDGEMVTTSPLRATKVLKPGATVTTATGSKYKLGQPKPTASSPSMSFGGLGNLGGFNNGKKKNGKAAGNAPTVNDWFISFRGELIGVVSNHPDRSIATGDTITTSKINENRNSIKEGDVVTTSSGSRYLLGSKKRGLATSIFNKNKISNESAEANGGTFNSGVRLSTSGESSSSISSGNGGSSRSFGLRSFQMRNPSNTLQSSSSSPSSSSSNQQQKISNNKPSNNGLSRTFGLLNQKMMNAMNNQNRASSSRSSSFPSTTRNRTAATPSASSRSTSVSASNNNGAELSPQRLEKERMRNLKEKFGINGKTLANGKYLLCDRARRSTSGKSNIWNAYQADANGNPFGNKLTIKVSTNFDSMIREDNNYNRVCSGLFPGRFVEKAEFLESLDGNPVREFETSCALVIENGRKDLRAILNERGGRGFEGKAMRDAASAALQCVQAMHSSGIVWTDLKTENFVIVSDEIGDNGMLPGVKGIDLESAIPRGKNPVDFSPEACPPEFASAFIAGEGLNFKLDYSYDIWSYGMMLFELTTGKPYFDNKTPAQITMALQYEFEADLSSVSDDKLRDLIKNCLKYDPKKRPGVTQLLLHPYFLSTGFGPFGF